ncbi:MAG TPA: type IV pilus modification protein PilV [Arenimonas sp.]|uniref:type IV pilus modification protein PilV n=1 Tax=Arenimonas sp. TaxID=1872635 RepID=UPI002CE05A03|nr:type IV pilus modification protein PilV [Arenimonas sp.]HMB57207.1 type IV pilus modification protein PilV [Arenimonas sp.]
MTIHAFQGRRHPAAASRGVSLIEVLIAVLILAIGLLGIAALQASALRNSQSSLERSQAVIYTYSILDAMRANPLVARAGTYNQVLPAGACVIPAASATDLSANDRRQWLQKIQQNLGTTACGSINCTIVAAPNYSQCAVSVRWDDSRGTSGVAAGTLSTITTVSQL